MELDANLFLKGTLKVGSAAVVTSIPHLMGIDANGNVRRFANTNSAPIVYQIDSILGTNYGLVNLSAIIPNEVGSYRFKITLEFGDVSNSAYRLAAQRTIDFSLVVYNDGTATLAYSHSQLNMVSHSGQLVKVTSPMAFHSLILEDIEITPVIISKKLYIQVQNNIGSSPIYGSVGSMKCRFTAEFSRFTWTSGGHDDK